MKKTAVAVLVVLAILLLTPLALGRLAERHAVALLDGATEDTSYLSVVGHEWERGWFRSRQQVTLELVQPDDAARERFIIHNHILHGPLLGLSGIGAARVTSTVDLPAELAADLRETFGPEPAMTMTTRFGFLGGGSTRLVSQGRTLTPADGEAQIMYETARLKVGFDRGMERYAIDGRLPRIEVRGRDGQLAVFDRLTLEGDARSVAGFRYLHDSQFAMRLRGVEVSGPATSFAVQDARYAGEMKIRDGLVGIAIELGSGAVEGAPVQASALAVTGLHYDLSLDRLDAASVEAMYASIQDAYSQLPDPAAEVTGDAVAQQQAVEQGFAVSMAQHVDGMLAHDPVLTLRRVALLTPDGEVLLEGEVRVVDLTLQDLQAAGLPGMLGRLQADLEFSMAQAVAGKLPNGEMMAEFGITAGYLLRETDQLVSRIQYRNGTLTVNGQTQVVPLPGVAR